MVVAELEVYLSRPIAPTRRVALGDSLLPVDHAPGFGGVLLGGVVARFAPFVDPELVDEMLPLLRDLRLARRVAQPRLRHRFQVDRVGLRRCRHRLISSGEMLTFDIDEELGTPEQQVLAAVYAAAALPPTNRDAVFDALEKSLEWRAPVGPALIAYLTGSSARLPAMSIGDPVQWAIGVLDIADEQRDDRIAVQKAFRRSLRHAHPDHGGASDDAAQRIATLTEARRILIG